VIEKGFSRILLYGAGEVAEILLQAITIDHNIPVVVLGIIDDDPIKQNSMLVNTQIIPIESISKLEHDGILISSYTNNQIIFNNLKNNNYNKNKIIQFFE
jgi:FlaA1/EpsC-like NDP-sugar epimerase